MYKLLFVRLFGFWLIVSTAAAQQPNTKFLGCYLGDGLLTLGEESRTLGSNSPESCSAFCSGKQYTFFILKNDVCHCSKNYISRLMKQYDHECSKECTGDKSTSCGGPSNLVSAYITDVSKSINFLSHGGYPIPIYLGCYSESPNDDDNRLLKGPAQQFNNNSPMKCSATCFNMGYLYFGLTYGMECWCGNQQPSKTPKVDDTNCNTPCNGDNKLFCGGGWKMSIYSTGITDNIPKKYVGCFEDKENKPKGKHLSFQMGNNNSPRRCMNLCNTQRFKYAAVKDNVCECQNSEPNFNLKRISSDCNIPCAENPAENCGGGTSYLNIYKTIYKDPHGKSVGNNIGCFNNLKRHPTLNGWRLTINQLTPKKCIQSCFARRYPYAALMSSKECMCSFTKPSNEAKTEDIICTTSCAGARELTCGGNNAIEVYTTGLEWKTDSIGNYYVGCYEESQNNRLYNGFSKSYPTNTPEFCSNLCYRKGYTYSGVTYKSECFCGSQSPNERMFNKMDDKQCNTKCSGDANQYCGGGWRMGVFFTGLSDFEIENRKLGCYQPQENTLNVKFELINTNTPNRCAAICNDAAYLFAGVIGVNCLCGNRAPEDDLKLSDSDCDLLCDGDSSKTCGGEDRIQIYDIKKQINVELSTPEVFNIKEEFDTLDTSLWSHDIYVPQEPDFEFVIYNNSDKNAFVKNGELVIKPKILPDLFVKKGCFELKGCTKDEGSIYCMKNATSYNIIPPIVSSKLTTKNRMYTLYGELEVIAKLPKGDWIVPEIAMVSKANEENRLVLATSFGNNDLICNGDDASSKVLRYGLKIDEQMHVTSNMMKSILKSPWSNDYHSFVLSWTPKSIAFKIDGESNFLDTSNLPMDVIFESEYYISIGVSVGGMTNFNDNCLSNGHQKPWKNLDNKAMLNFWKDKSHWAPTWNDDKSTLRVKSVKFTTIDNTN